MRKTFLILIFFAITKTFSQIPSEFQPVRVNDQLTPRLDKDALAHRRISSDFTNRYSDYVDVDVYMAPQLGIKKISIQIENDSISISLIADKSVFNSKQFTLDQFILKGAVSDNIISYLYLEHVPTVNISFTESSYTVNYEGENRDYFFNDEYYMEDQLDLAAVVFLNIKAISQDYLKSGGAAIYQRFAPPPGTVSDISCWRIGGTRSLATARTRECVTSYLASHANCTLVGIDTTCMFGADHGICMASASFSCTSNNGGPVNWGPIWDKTGAFSI